MTTGLSKKRKSESQPPAKDPQPAHDDENTVTSVKKLKTAQAADSNFPKVQKPAPRLVQKKQTTIEATKDVPIERLNVVSESPSTPVRPFAIAEPRRPQALRRTGIPWIKYK